MEAPSTPATLGCGHPNDWGHGFGAYDLLGKSFCKACLTERELLEMKCARNHMSYLSADSKTLTDWGSGAIATVIGAPVKHKSRRYSQGSVFSVEMWTFRARDRNGQDWACRHWPSAGNYVRMRRLENAR